jgi:hypothetical protein
MSLSFISCLVALFFLRRCLSSSCPPLLQPLKVPCNKSIEIRPPFFLINGTTHFCENAINIRCTYHDSSSPRVYLFHSANVYFHLENILYAPNNSSQKELIVTDPSLAKHLRSSFCGNLQFSFLNLSHELFDYGQFSSLSANIQSFCRSQNLSFSKPICEREYTMNYSRRTDEYLAKNCYRKSPNTSFEWKFAFGDDGNVILLSAQYSYNLLSQQGCFSQSIVGDYNKGQQLISAEKIILIQRNFLFNLILLKLIKCLPIHNTSFSSLLNCITYLPVFLYIIFIIIILLIIRVTKSKF